MSRTRRSCMEYTVGDVSLEAADLALPQCGDGAPPRLGGANPRHHTVTDQTKILSNYDVRHELAVIAGDGAIGFPNANAARARIGHQPRTNHRGLCAE